MNTKSVVAITQNVLNLKDRKEIRDSLDQKWVLFLNNCDIEPLIISNTHQYPDVYAEKMGTSGVILTGGNNFSHLIKRYTNIHQKKNESAFQDSIVINRDRTELALLDMSIKKKWPVIGVCRGMQLLNIYHGGNISPVIGHVNRYHIINSKIPENLSYTFDYSVNSFHNYGILKSDITNKARLLAWSDDVVEAFMISDPFHIGIMWHPERNDPFSKNDIQLFCNVFKK